MDCLPLAEQIKGISPVTDVQYEPTFRRMANNLVQIFAQSVMPRSAAYDMLSGADENLTMLQTTCVTSVWALPQTSWKLIRGRSLLLLPAAATSMPETIVTEAPGLC